MYQNMPRFVSLLALKVSIYSHERLMLLFPLILMFNTPPYISFLFFYSFSRQMRQIFTSDTSMSELETPKFQPGLVRQELQLSMDPLLLIKMILYQHRSIVEMTMGNWSSIGLLIVHDTLNLTVKRQLRPWIIGNQLCLFFSFKKTKFFENWNNSFFALITL